MNMQHQPIVREGHPATILVLDEVRRERELQDVKWGVQRHQSVLAMEPEARAMHYGIPTEARAKERCEEAFKEGLGTWADIAVEELAEVVCARDDVVRRGELVQLAAVCAAWIEDIDRRHLGS